MEATKLLVGGNKTKLNIGCGEDRKEGYINIDNSKNSKADIKDDILSFLERQKDNSVEEILCWNVLEHLPELKPLKILQEAYRILQPNGKFKFRVPMAFSINDKRAIDHLSSFTPLSFRSRKWYNYKFKEKIWITPPLIHIRLPWQFFYINFIIPIFTGIEGELTKEGYHEKPLSQL